MGGEMILARVNTALQYQWQHKVARTVELLSNVLPAHAVLEGDEEPALWKEFEKGKALLF